MLTYLPSSPAKPAHGGDGQGRYEVEGAEIDAEAGDIVIADE